MKKFIIKILLFILPVVLFSYILDLIISNYLKKSNSHAQKEYSTWNDIMSGKLNSDIYIYGSSRAWHHFDPSILEDSLHQSVYNLGMDGHTFRLQYLRHLLAMKYNPKPKKIIFSVDIGILNKGNMYNADQFLPYMLWNSTFYNYLSLYDGYNYYDYNIPLIRYYGKYDAIKTIFKMIVLPNSNKVERVKGYQSINTHWNNNFENAKKSMKKYTATPDSISYFFFDKCLKECKENNMDVVLVYSPYYIEGQNFIENQSQILNLFQTIANKYNYTFIDFTKDEMCLEKKYFVDASHLNKEGAEVFTKKLCNKLK